MFYLTIHVVKTIIHGIEKANESLNKYVELLEWKDSDLEKHNSNLYHINALHMLLIFLNCYKNLQKEMLLTP